MRILFDQGTPVPLRRYLVGHEVVTAFEKGWSTLKNGELLQAAENNDFTVLLTTDMNLRYQQNLSIRKISVVVLSTTSWPRIKSEVSAVAEAVAASTIGSYIEVIIP